MIGLGGKKFRLLHKEFDKIYKKVQNTKPRKRSIANGRQEVIKDTKTKLLFILMQTI